MHILGRIKLPKSGETSSLYIKCNQRVSINFDASHPEILLEQGGSISTNCYFNSFYENFYTKYTSLSLVYYLLKLEGDFQVTVYREVSQTSDRELISSEKFENCKLLDDVKVKLSNLAETETPGRIYFELLCLSERGVFKQGLITTAQTKSREISLGIITCTFNKEAYIKNTVNTILQDTFLQAKELKVFVVDNGRTLSEDDFKDTRVQLIPNKNVGGSGGFTRGLIAALQADTYSHFLFMDDDIELESESIYRLFTLYEYAKFDFAVAGSMLDLYKKHVLYEAGALYGKRSDNMKSGPFTVAPLKHNLDLESPNSLNVLLLEENVDYGAFWFFAFSKEVVEQIGLPMPLFIRIDDVEFCLRIKKCLSDKIVAFPSIAVWHEPFYAKYPIWDNYYIHRNSLITDTIHLQLKYIDAVVQISEALILALCFFEYNSAQMIVKGFEDYLKGPNFLKHNAPELIHSDLLKLSKSYSNQKIQQNYLPSERVEEKLKHGKLKKIISLLTLNGHLLPNFLTTDDEVFIWQDSESTGQRSKAFGKKRVIVFKEGTNYLVETERDKLAGIELFNRWLQLAARSSSQWSSISREWKAAARELTSTEFWQQYLELKK